MPFVFIFLVGDGFLERILNSKGFEDFLKVYLGVVYKYEIDEPSALLILNTNRAYFEISSGPSRCYMLVHSHIFPSKGLSDGEITPQDKEFFSKMEIHYVGVAYIKGENFCLKIYKNKDFKEIGTKCWKIPDKIIIPKGYPDIKVFLERPPGLRLEEEVEIEKVISKEDFLRNFPNLCYEEPL